jgi:hypothetical protein
LAESGEVVVIRNESVPLLRLSRFLGLTQETASAERPPEENSNRRLAVIVEAGRRKVGLVVDELLGQQQVVVKSLERNLRRIDGLMGATILGDGRVAPIVDVTGLGALDLFSLQASSQNSQQVAPPAQSVRAASSKERNQEERHMNWFKNLNATPRLMSSFGVLLVLTLGISYLAISNLSKANDRVQALYQEDMKGVIAVQNIAASKLDVARLVRDAIIKIDDPAAVAADLNSIKSAYASMHSNLQDAEQCFYTKEGKAMLASIGDAQPKYEQAVSTVSAAIEAKDAARAKANLLGIAAIAAQMTTDIDRALKLKESASEDKFQANNQAYQTGRTLMISATAISLVLGVILSIVIARGFSVPLGQAVAVLERVAGRRPDRHARCEHQG